ncbi:uncharacterized protein LOC132730808 [Ruditapes philippinarum]|uniref:uncharacterized protein LOC132730808 n=1 Tax=Ruditapes philippinarum TaxID=129788 RepID=UPI00295B1BAB|nr:uncharacterized protein LOC132730808 [Ruditapes philippinarum]
MFRRLYKKDFEACTEKEPNTPDVLKLLIKRFVSEKCSLADLRIVTLFVICFAGFLRISEGLYLKRCHIDFKDDHCSLYIENARTDLYREGNYVVLAKTGKFSCPVQLLHRYITEAGLMECYDQFIFRAVVLCKKSNKYVLKRKNAPLSYSRTRELFNQKLTSIGLESHQYGLHSLRSGGALICANSGTNDRLWKKHGRWRSETGKDGYVEDSLKQRLSVSLNLNI